MFKFKQFRGLLFTGLLLIVMLASLTYLASSTSLAKKPLKCPEWSIGMDQCGVCEMCIPDPNNPDSAAPPDCFNLPVGFSVCAETVLKRLGHVGKNPTAIEFSIYSAIMSFENSNPECNSTTAEGSTFIGDKRTIGREIAKNEVSKNGTAIIDDLCFTYDSFQDLIRPNKWWSNCWLDLESFDVEFVLTQDGEPQHVIRATCEPSACVPVCDRFGDCDEVNGVDLNCTQTCDSQTGDPEYCE